MSRKQLFSLCWCGDRRFKRTIAVKLWA